MENQYSRGLYRSLGEFAREHGQITYPQFDEYVMKNVSLFDVPEDGYFMAVEEILDDIIKALPAFKRIFARPIVRLKDDRQVVPIEAVKIIDNRSLIHASSRSEMWEDITETGIKPRKLMTVEYVETYAIYENIAFACAVDTVLSYIKHTMMRLKDVLYGCRDIHFNLLDRTHHSLYFLAIGKLYLEYVRARDSRSSWSKCIEKLLFIEKTLRGKLSSPVYRKCKRESYNIKLKKTNIFRSHKDYAEVYRILKLFESDRDEDSVIGMTSGADGEDYRVFCQYLSLFAAGHFNYEFQKDGIIDLDRLDVTCSYLGWTLNMAYRSECGVSALVFTTKKDAEYRSCLVLTDRKRVSASAFDSFKAEIGADEYLFCSPDRYGDRQVIYLSIFDVDSFLRIQQVLLRGMILSDTARDVCAFCGKPLEISAGGHECPACRAEIRELTCPETNKSYYVSDIVKLNSRRKSEDGESERRRFLHDRLSEARLHFRNITPMSTDGLPVCPYCNKVHR